MWDKNSRLFCQAGYLFAVISWEGWFEACLHLEWLHCSYSSQLVPHWRTPQILVTWLVPAFVNGPVWARQHVRLCVSWQTKGFAQLLCLVFEGTEFPHFRRETFELMSCFCSPHLWPNSPDFTPKNFWSWNRLPGSFKTLLLSHRNEVFLVKIS